MPLVGTYDPNQIVVSVAGRRIEGFLEQGATVAPVAEKSTYQNDINGGGTQIISRNDDLLLTLTMRLTSDGYRLLGEVFNQAQNGVFGPGGYFPVSVTNLITGETASVRQGFFRNTASQEYGTTLGGGVFTIHMPRARRTQQFGPFNNVIA